MIKQLPIRWVIDTVIFDESSDEIAILEVKSGNYHKIPDEMGKISKKSLCKNIYNDIINIKDK